MRFAYTLGGGQPVVKKYKMAAGHARGIVVLTAAANATGLSTSTTTSFADAVGVTMDAGPIAVGNLATYSTTQGDPEFLQSVLVNPDAVFQALMVGSAANAAIANNTIGTAASNGLTCVGTTGDQDPSSPSFDEGTVWYTTGSNASASRKITSVTTPLTTTVVMPFAANAVWDTYCIIDYTIGTIDVTTSTDLQNVRVDIAATGAEAVCVDLELNGRTNSYIHIKLHDHLFGINT